MVQQIVTFVFQRVRSKVELENASAVTDGLSRGTTEKERKKDRGSERAIKAEGERERESNKSRGRRREIKR